MRPNRLHSLLARNRGRGEFRADVADDAGSENVIWLYDQIVATEEDAYWFGGVAADSFAKALLAMEGPVTIRINSPGGDTFAGTSMASAIMAYPGAVTAYVDGFAASAASFITSAADRTVMAPGSMLMIHKCWTIAMGNSEDFAASSALLAKIDVQMAGRYTATAEKRGKTDSDFMALMAAETWLTEDEAIELGLADEIAVGADKSASTAAQARWDVSAYAHAPHSHAAEPAPGAPAERAAATQAADPPTDIERLRRIAAVHLKTTA